MTTVNRKIRFAICLTSDEPDLERGKVYRVLTDAEEERTGWLRVVDESHEDYLYPAQSFAFVTLPLQAQKAISPTASIRSKRVRRKSARKSA